MTANEKLLKQAEETLRRLERYEIALTNIALGYWNAGREEPISAEDYAKQALADTLRPRLEPRS